MIPPRFIRLRDAPAYLGMHRDTFARDVRPYLTEVPIGIQGVAFDRLDLDAWADHHKRRNGRPAEKGQPWDALAPAESPPTATAIASSYVTSRTQSQG